MKTKDSRRFPQKRNGVYHPKFGAGVATTYAHSVSAIGDKIMVKFDHESEDKLVPCNELTSLPSHSVSPDSATSRNSGWIGGNNYRSKS
jgi:hypothetical protein